MSVCKDCPKRQMGCHDRCPDYQKEKAEREAAKKYLYDWKACQFDSFHKSNYLRTKQMKEH